MAYDSVFLCKHTNPNDIANDIISKFKSNHLEYYEYYWIGAKNYTYETALEVQKILMSKGYHCFLGWAELTPSGNDSNLIQLLPNQPKHLTWKEEARAEWVKGFKQLVICIILAILIQVIICLL